MKTNRKIIQMIESDFSVTGLCDDGTVWGLYNIDDGWKRFPDIPQDEIEDFPIVVTGSMQRMKENYELPKTNQKTFTKEQLASAWWRMYGDKSTWNELCKELGFDE